METIPQVKISVTGGREFDNTKLVQTIFRGIARIAWSVTLIHGAARGLDTIADEQAKDLVWWVEAYPVSPDEWKLYGKRAGHIRNRKMLEESKPHILLSFPGGSGTANCIKSALQMGIPVESFWDTPPLTLYAKIDKVIDTISKRLKEENTKKELTSAKNQVES
jgi:YspA, cpYpsA-related SLOG family